jgi:hypothetical protein
MTKILNVIVCKNVSEHKIDWRAQKTEKETKRETVELTKIYKNWKLLKIQINLEIGLNSDFPTSNWLHPQLLFGCVFSRRVGLKLPPQWQHKHLFVSTILADRAEKIEKYKNHGRRRWWEPTVSGQGDWQLLRRHWTAAVRSRSFYRRSKHEAWSRENIEQNQINENSWAQTMLQIDSVSNPFQLYWWCKNVERQNAMN